MVEKIKILSKREVVHNVLMEWLTLFIISLGLAIVTVGVHNIGVPLYKINPMHWILYFYILQKKPRNSSIIIISILMPLSSTLLTGHPIIIKGFIMTVELMVYGLVFDLIFRKSSKFFVTAFIISQLSGKTVYYCGKYILIKYSLMEASVFSTALIYQIIIPFIMLITFYYTKKIDK